MNKKILTYSFWILSFTFLFAQRIPNGLLLRSTLGSSGKSSTKNTLVQQSVGQASVIGTFYHNSWVLRQGFIQVNDLSITDSNQDSALLLELVYPNPCSNFFSLNFNSVIETEIIVELYNIVGTKVYVNQYTKKQDVTIVAEHLNAGNYIIKVFANQKIFHQKITKY